MKKLPDAPIYELELLYFPWGDTIRKVIEIAVDQIPQGALVLDVMCGPGQLLGMLKALRPDLKLTGLDIDEGFIGHAKKRHEDITFETGHVLGWLHENDSEYDVIICTAGMHHLEHNKQGSLIQKISSHIKKGGFFISAEPYIAPFSNELERKIAVTKLGTAYLLATLEKTPPSAIIEATIDILHNDLFLDGEYKNSLREVYSLIQKSFKNSTKCCTWSSGDDSGEYVIIGYL